MDYQLLGDTLYNEGANSSVLTKVAEKVGVSLPDNEDPAKSMWRLLQCDFRSAKLRRSITGSPTEVREIADRIF